MKPKNANPLWTRDFTILTLGSVVSMTGNAMSGFAMSLLVLDYTQSTLLYAVYIAVYTLPQIIMPVFSGAILDRFSRKRTIYTLDFVTAGLFLIGAVLLGSGWFSFPLLAVCCFLLGSIDSVYTVAYQSFYPLLISEGNFSKAYSMSSVLELFADLMIPVSVVVYNWIGIAPLLALNGVCFLIAAMMETQIQTQEAYIDYQKANSAPGVTGVRRLLCDIREGFGYLRREKGLLAVAVYFTFSALFMGASSVIVLPFFKSGFENGEYIYMIVCGMTILGRAIGGGLHYHFLLPSGWKYGIALVVYLMVDLIEGFYLYFTVPVMMCMCFVSGILGVTSYTIRISATQSYVPDEKKGRFNGAFNMLSTVGSLCGELLAGALTVVFPARAVLSGFALAACAAALVFIGGGRTEVKRLYNTQQ